MPNLFDYLIWRGDLKFSSDPVNEIDSLIFSQLTFLNIEKYIKEKPRSLQEALELFFKDNPPKTINLGLIVPKTIVELGQKIKDTNRFKDIIIDDYVLNFDKNISEQFCAASFICDNKVVIAYQGTDDSIVGWEENFNMIREFPIPSQKSAVMFANKVCKKHHNKKIIIAGHSKGGNLAMYAAMFMNESYRDKVELVYNFDGPGFEIKYIPEDKIDYLNKKIINIIPYRSIIGMLLSPIGELTPVKSKNRGIFQHDSFSWSVTGNKFDRAISLSKESKNINEGINNLIATMSYEDREEFCVALKKATDAAELDNLVDLKTNTLKLLRGYKFFSSKTKKTFFALTKLLIKNKVLL